MVVLRVCAAIFWSLAGAGFRGDSAWIVENIQPTQSIGATLAQLERYVRGHSKARPSPLEYP